jgi:DNA-binding NarL/FixJ family response regulator
VLIGRDREVRTVLDLVGRGSSCALVGEAGIGKTAVLHAVGAELGSRATLGGAVQPLRWMPYLALQRACGLTLSGTRAEVMATATSALRGRVLLVDDLHWADPDTLELLPELAHEVAIVATVRTNDDCSATALAVATALGSVLQIEPLPDDAARTLALDTVPTATESELRALVQASGGNPLLLTCAPVLPGTAAADERLFALVARASEPARHSLAGLVLRGRPSCDDGYEELARLGLVVQTEERGWTVRHDSFGQAALSLLSPSERIEIHRHLAATSTTDGERARHYLHSGDPDQARIYALRAAQNASSRNERADHLAIAAVPVNGVEDPDILLDASEALALAGRVDDGLAFAQRAIPKDRVGVLRREKNIAWCAWWAAQHDHVWPALEAAVELLTPEDAEVEVTVRLLRARYLARVAWDAPAAIAEARAAVALAEREALPVAEAYGALGAACLVTGDPDWDQWLAKSIAAARHENLEAVEITSADSLFIAQLVSGEPSECAPLARQMIDRAHAMGTRSGEAQFRKNLLMARFHVDDALDETLTAARHLMTQPLNPRQRDHVEAHLVLACADLGLDEEIPAILANAYGFTANDMTSRSMILWAKAEAAWLAGRAADAYETATECRSLPVGGFPSHVMVEPIRQLAALDLGIDPGPALSGALFPNLVGANKESQAIVAMYEHPEASENAGRFLAASRSWDRISRRNAARCAWAAGEAARRAGDTERAITILRMIEPELLASGRRPLLRRVDASLRALGQRVHAHQAEAIAPLTAAQVEVLDLVGRGLDTRAIARRLVVSETTVETHVRQSMQRLGVPTRLAAAMELVRRRADRQTVERADQRIAVSDNPADLPAQAIPLSGLPVAPWTLPSEMVASGVVQTDDDIARAFIAASRGASLVITIGSELSSPARVELLDALARISPVERLQPAEPSDTDDELSDALRVLAAGGSVIEAAHEVHMSERTLHRKLARLRQQLGVTSNAAAARQVLSLD